MASKQWWMDDAIICFEGLIGGWELRDINIKEISDIVDKYAATGCNTVHLPVISTGSGCGTNPEGFFFKSLTEPNNNSDLLGEFLKEFHKRNIKVIIYFNGHSFVREFYNRHPEWVMMSEKGEPVLDVYKTGVSACPNNAGYREWQAGVVRDLCGYEIDGVFLDGDIFFENTCYCKTCRELFKLKYKVEMPLKSLRNHPEWRLLREFQIDSLTSYIKHLYTVLKECRATALLYCNAGLRTANWATGRQNRRLMDVQDMLLSEGGFLYSNLNSSPAWRIECENKLCLTQSGGKPVISGMAMDHKEWNWYQLPDAEVRLMMHGAIAAGAYVYAGTSSLKNKPEKVISNIKGLNEYIDKNRKILYPCKSMAKTGIVWSNVNADFYAGGSIKKTDFTKSVRETEIGDLHMEFEGFYDLCFRKHIPVDVLDEVSLTDGSLKKYDVIILPNIACLSDYELGWIRQYVQNGGVLLSSFETSLYNEFGEMRSKPGLDDVFGIEFKEKLIYGPLLWDYIMPSDNKYLFTDKLSEYVYLPAPKYCIKTQPITAMTIADCAEFMEGSYDGYPTRSSNGFIYVNSYGLGKSIYFAGTVGQVLMEWHFKEYMDLLGDIINTYSKPFVRVFNAPETVSVNIRNNIKENIITIYMVNYSGHMSRPISNVLDTRNITLGLDCKVKNAYALSGKTEITFKNNGDESTIIVPYLGEFEAIVVNID